MGKPMPGHWKVEIIWPMADQTVTSKVKHDGVEITDGGVLWFWLNGQRVAAYGPGFWVSAAPESEG